MQVGAALRRIATWTAVGIVAGASGAVSTPASASASGFTCANGPGYDVASGDSWYGIAERFEISVRSLVDANGASLESLLMPGDRLCLPAGADRTLACASTYAVLAGDSWAAIAARAGSSAAAVARSNGREITSTIHPGDVVCLPDGTSAGSAATGTSVAAGSNYTVVSGDSWAAIAARARVAMSSLLAVNDSSSADLLHPGDVLLLPAGAELVTAASVRLEAAPTQGPCGYGDTWGDARDGGRSHAGTDIFSGSGNYVYAVVDGRLTGRVWDGAGQNAGNAWTLTGTDGTRYFYAHLSDFAPELRVGSNVRAGQVIGWVGSTGNSSAPHLHFEVRPGGGVPVNPYPILRSQGGCNDDRPYVQPGGWIPDRIT